MFILVKDISNVNFDNEFLRLAALSLSLLANLSFVAVPLIFKQSENRVSNLRKKIDHYEKIEEKLQCCTEELRSIQIICESSENASEVFSPDADKAKIAAYYQGMIYQIKEKIKLTLGAIGYKSRGKNNSNNSN
ncbi:hypothetical protein [Okeania sp. KiyG1]|uniref:hypothetical protein n=1 Tax=Okeania sp. KiyG1 TaxID=2720165 RepID=UPI001923A5B6|nr:hypothetical protein [Okeania sp. KiyG1]GGA53398.1 hypothetical protein CYANOKiyG1_73440 [Okeania sp. KiyG1]